MTKDDLFLGNTTNADARQVGSDHYKVLGIQPWNVVDTWTYYERVGFYRGNVLKYLLRAFTKGNMIQDLQKAEHYLQKLIEVVTKEKEEWNDSKL